MIVNALMHAGLPWIIAFPLAFYLIDAVFNPQPYMELPPPPRPAPAPRPAPEPLPPWERRHTICAAFIVGSIIALIGAIMTHPLPAPTEASLEATSGTIVPVVPPEPVAPHRTLVKPVPVNERPIAPQAAFDMDDTSGAWQPMKPVSARAQWLLHGFHAAAGVEEP